MFASSDDESSKNEHPLNVDNGTGDGAEFTDVLNDSGNGVHDREVPLGGSDSPTGIMADHRTVGTRT